MTKKELAEKVGEVGRAVWEIRLFEMFMGSVVVFLAFAVVLTLAGGNILHGMFPAVVYLLAMFFRSAMKSDTIGTIEDMNAGLRERLKTAYQNRGRDNIIVEHLVSEVSGDIDRVESSSFFDSRRVSSRVTAAILLVILMLLITVIDLRGLLSNAFDLDDLSGRLRLALAEHGIEYEKITGDEERWEESNLTTSKEKEKLGAEPGGERPGFHMGPIPGSGGGIGSDDSSEIYGEASSAVIEGERVELRLRPDYGGETEIKDDGRNQVKVLTEAPGVVESSESCEECAIGPEHEDLVKRYFEKIIGEA